MSDAGARIAARAARLLESLDHARVLEPLSAEDPSFDVASAYAIADELRRLRMARGERPVGYKIGFTNRGIWARYGVFAPIWAPVWDSTVELVANGEASASLAAFVEPRLEPEIMFGFARTPEAGASIDELAGCLAWVAHGYEIVHTHFPGWRFAAADTVADFGLHGRLFVGPRVPIERFAASGSVAGQLAAVRVALSCDGELVEEGSAEIVLGGPLHALRLWVDAMAAQPQQWPIRPGDIVTTGTITDAAPLLPGHTWQTRLDDERLAGMTLRTTA